MVLFNHSLCGIDMVEKSYEIRMTFQSIRLNETESYSVKVKWFYLEAETGTSWLSVSAVCKFSCMFGNEFEKVAKL